MGQSKSITLKSTQSISMPIRDKLAQSNENKEEYNEDKYKEAIKYYDYLFNYPIEYCEICFDKLGQKPFHEVSKLFEPIRQNIPFLGSKFFYHAYLIVGVCPFDKRYFHFYEQIFYFLIEYGGYPSTEQVYKYFTKYEYGKEGGLRYTMMDNDYYQKLKQDLYISLEINKVSSIRNLINFCKKDNNIWTKSKYDLTNHNCQDFAALALQYLNCKRFLYEDDRGTHSLSKIKIPGPILRQLEKNEKDKTNILGYIPFIGQVSDFIIEKIYFFRNNKDKQYLKKLDTKCFWCEKISNENYYINEEYEICELCFYKVMLENVDIKNLDEHTLYRCCKRSFFCEKCTKPFYYSITYFCDICNKYFCYSCIKDSCQIILSFEKNKEIPQEPQKIKLDRDIIDKIKKKEKEKEEKEEKEDKIQQEIFSKCLYKK